MAKRNGRSDSERHAFENEVLAQMPPLRAYAISLERNEMRAEDLVQETLLRALANWDSFEPGTKMLAWLFTILRNLHRSNWRKSKREQEWDPVFENALRFSTGLAEDGMEATHDFHRLLLYLVCIPAEQSDALIAVGYLGLSYEDAAERLGCAVGTIKSRTNRGRAKLATIMQGAVFKPVDLTKLKTATKGIPKSHPYFPIAKVYEDLYYAWAEVVGGAVGYDKINGHDGEAPSSEKLWEDLVASGALDEMEEDLGSLMRS